MSIALRPLKTSQLPELSRGFNRVFKEYLPWTIKLEKHFYPSYVPENRSNTCVALDGRKVVAHASGKAYPVRIGRAEISWSSYGNVMTLPEYRGKGIASRINARLWKKLRADGVDGVYISGGRGLYTRVGATPSGRYFDFLVKSAQLPSAKGLKLKACGPKDLPALLALQDSEKVGFVRTERDFHSVLHDGISYLNRAKAYLVLSHSTPLAFFVLGPAWRDRKLKRPKRAALHDYAGSRSALLSGLKLSGYREIEVPVAGHDAELLWQLGGKGKYSTVGGTHLILDPVRLMRRLQPYFGEKVSFKRKGRGFEFKLGKHRKVLAGLPELTKFILGSKASAGGPFKKIFPLPFPVIGLNWT